MKFLSQINVNTEYTLPIVDGTNGQVLTSDGNGAVYWGSIAAGVTTLDGLTDVILTGPSSGQLLRYGIPPGSGETSPVWYNFTPNYLTPSSSIDNLGDVTITSATSGQILQYNGTAWVNTTLSTVEYVSKVQHIVKAGVAITKGQAVYVTSADGTNMIVGLASNAAESTSSKVIGLAASNAAINDQIFVVTEGLIAGLNTSTATAGDPVWLGTGGNLIFGLLNKPVAPAHLVYIGVVTRVQQNNGEIFVNVQNGFELNEIHDALIVSPTAGQLLRRDSDNLWKNWTPNFLTAETDTLATVTARGATTTSNITVNGAAFATSFSATGLLIANADTSGGLQPDQGSPANKIYSFRWMGNEQGYIDTDAKITFAGFKTPTGTASQFLKANGTVDSNVYITSAALSGYATQSWVNSNFYNQGQIDDFFSGAEPISGYNKSNWDTAYGWGNHASAGYATTSYVTTAIANLVDAAPSTLDTLNELAAALGDDPNFATTVTNSIATKLPLAGGTLTGNLYMQAGTQIVLNGWGESHSIFVEPIAGASNGKTRTIFQAADDFTYDQGWEFRSYRYDGLVATRFYIPGDGGKALMNGANVATETWVQSQGYLTSETDSQTLDWDAPNKNLSITNGNTVTLDGLATEEFVTSQGYITGYTETDTLATVTARGATTSVASTFSNTLTVSGDNAIFKAYSVTADTSLPTKRLAEFAGIYNNGSNGHQMFISSTASSGPWEINQTKTWGGILSFGVSANGTEITRKLYVTPDSVGVNVYPTSGDQMEVAGALRVHTGNNWDGVQIYADGQAGYIRGRGDEIGLHIRSEYGNVLLASDRGNVAIGKSTASYKLDVGGNARFDNEIYVNGVWSSGYGPRNNGENINFWNWSGNVKARISTSTGVIAANDTKLSLGILDLNSGVTPTQFRINTKIPFVSSGADFTVNIKGFRYGDAQMVSLSIGWHYYANQLYNRTAISNGAWSPTITMAKDANGFVVIHLAGPGYWPKLYVESVHSSSYGDAYSSNWSWTDADLSDCTDVQSVTYRPLATSITGSSSYATSSGNSVSTDQTNFSELFIDNAPVATKEYVTSQGYITGYTETDTLATVTGRGATTSTAVTFNGNVTLGNAADLSFVDLAGTFPTSGKGFDWTLNNDGARIYAIQPSSDSIDLVFQLRDNATTNDRFVFHVDEWQGAAYDKYPLIISGGTQFDLKDSNLYTNSVLRLSNSGVLQNVTGNISMFTNDSGYITSSGNTSGYSGSLSADDNRTISPSEIGVNQLKFGFTSWTNNNGAPYADYLHMRSYTDASGGSDNLVMFKKSGIGMRIWQQTFGSSTAYSSYADVWTTENFSSTDISNWNAAYNDKINSASFNTTNGILTLTQQDGGTVTVDLDGRYLTSDTDAQTLTWDGGSKTLGITNGNDVILSELATEDYVLSQGFISSEADTLATVTGRGASTSTAVTFNGGVNLAADIGIRKAGDNWIIGYSTSLPGIAIGSGTPTDKVSISSGGTQRVWFDTNGNVGIGTSSPSEKLHVSGAAIFDGGSGNSSTDAVVYVTKSNNNDWGLYVNASGLDYGMYTRVSPSAGYAFAIHNGTTWTTRITGDGRLHLNQKDTIASYDSWLRLNQSGEYGSGVYTPYALRNDGPFDNYGGIYGYSTIRARKAQTAGSYASAALWTESYDATTTGIAFHISGNVGKFLEMRTDGILYWNGDAVLHSGNIGSYAWNSSNDGSGSGLDADLLDGQQGSYYQPASTAITTSNIASQSVSYATSSGNSVSTDQTNFSELFIDNSAVATKEYVTSQGYLTSLPSHNHDDRYYTESESDNRFVRKDTTGQYLKPYNEYTSSLPASSVASSIVSQMGGGGLRVDFMSNASFGSWAHAISFSGYNGYNMYQLAGHYKGSGGEGPDLYVRCEPNHSQNSWSSWEKLWHTGNDGSGSGLDADLLDGNHASAFYLATNPSGYITGSYLDDYTRGAYRVISDYGSNSTWYIRSNGQFVFGTAHDWTASFRLNIDNGSGYGNNGSWAYFGQQDSNTTNGTWRGVRIRKFANGNVDGDLSAGAYYIGDTRKDTNWDTAYGWGNHADAPYWNVSLTDAVQVEAQEVIFAGNVTIQGTLTESSSIRLKENITPLDPALDKVNQLEAVSYNKIGEDNREIGLIAEDVAELFPEVVTYNDEGQPQGIQYQRLSVILLKAVQELTERVNKLENK